jgi:mannose-1-phosphate guanylyltransferase
MHVVIIAGGRGERFWPRSTRARPKQFHRIVSDRTMIQDTFRRVYPDIPAGRIHVVAGPHLRDLIMQQLPELDGRNLIVEPQGRNTAPAIGLAATVVHRREGDTVMAVLSSDHLIFPRDRFLAALDQAAEAARSGGIVVFGMPPTRPATEYGYLEVGPDSLPGFDFRVFPVVRFREKPSRELAEEFVRRGSFLWNSGMFVFRTGVLLEAMAEHMPGLHWGLMRIRESLGSGGERAVMEREFAGFESISIDYGIMEKVDGLACIRPDFTWDDLGSWNALGRHLPLDERGNLAQGDVVLVDASGVVAAGDEGSLIAAVGVEELIIVKEGNRVLVCRRDQDQRVKEVLKRLEEREAHRRFL